MKYKIEHPTMKIEKDGNIISGSGIPVTCISIKTNFASSIEELNKFIDKEIIIKVFSEIDWEYLLGTGHWTPRMNDVIRLNSKIIDSVLSNLIFEYTEQPRNNVRYIENIYSGIYSYYYKFELIVKNGKFSFNINFK